MAQMRTKFNMGQWDVKMKEIKEYWRSLHPNKGSQDQFEIWNPVLPVTSWYLRLIDEEFAEDFEKTPDIAVVIGRDKAASPAMTLIYFTRGLEEQHRIQTIVHGKVGRILSQTQVELI